jgi:hypothetical protein
MIRRTTVAISRTTAMISRISVTSDLLGRISCLTVHTFDCNIHDFENLGKRMLGSSTQANMLECFGNPKKSARSEGDGGLG